ncbi:MAG TPA: BMP family ABC transporter substrate-binding protein [Roseiflexaceae bacterium]|nr:BMP family ABC transporter substrate-binding protein [Roseiflexaceae bacterium]
MRKSLIATLLMLALVVPMLAACGGTAATPTAAPAEPTAAPAEPTAAPAEPTAAPAEPTAAPAEPTAAPTEPPATLRVGLVTDVGKINDGTFNQYAYEGLTRAEQELGIEIAFIETQAPTDYDKNLQQFADQGFDLIIGVGFLMGDAIAEAAARNPDVKYAIVDFAYDPAIPNVRGLVFAEDQAGYLAGVLAASMTESGVVAAVGGVEIPPVQKFLLGYENGAKSVNSDIEVKRVYIDSFVDRARGAEAARSFIAEGADVIFGAGGQTGSGGIQAAAEDGVYVIGVDQDEYVTTFQNGATPGAANIISSAIKRVDVAVFETIKSVQDGTFEGGTLVFSAANDGVGLAPFHDADAAIPADVKALIATTVAGLANGSISTNVVLP